MFLISLITLLICESQVLSYKPVVLIHGIMFDENDYFDSLVSNIQQSHPGTVIHRMKILQEMDSYLPFWYQVTKWVEGIAEIIENATDEVNIIGYSQGSLMSRAAIEHLSTKKIHNYITLAGGHMGTHPAKIPPPAGNIFTVGKNVERTISSTGVFRDPKDFDKPKREGAYIAALNNEFKHELNKNLLHSINLAHPTSINLLKTKISAQDKRAVLRAIIEYKENICNLNMMVLVAGPDDGFINPWQSGLFSYDDANGNIIDMKDLEIYKKDAICLKTLDERGKLKRFQHPGVDHNHWPSDYTVFEKYILPYLD